jgi:cytochrome P450
MTSHDTPGSSAAATVISPSATAPHYCLGAALGRLGASVVLDQVLVRRPGTALAAGRDELQFGHWPGDGFHLLRLPVRL